MKYVLTCWERIQRYKLTQVYYYTWNIKVKALVDPSCLTFCDPMERHLAGYSSWGHKESDTTECTHIHMIYTIQGFPGGSDGKESAWNTGDSLQFRRCSFNHWVRKIPWRREWHPLLQYSLLENSLDWGVCGAIVHGVTKSQTWWIN